MSDMETAVRLERAEASQGSLPAELSFEEVVKNRTLPPCSMNDFMDYLYYVEHNAESLQFFLWYCDYIQRWSTLLPRQKALSPVWDPEKAKEERRRFVTYSHKRAMSDKINKIIEIMEMEHEKDVDGRESNVPAGAVSVPSTNFSRPRTASTTSTLSLTDSKEDIQAFTIQPFRDEVSRIVRHYIVESGPRSLNLSPQDRESILHAVHHTTHPSALMPALVLAEANLKGHSHPNFVGWSRSNGNKPRLIFLRIIGALLLFLGLALDVLFILSGLSHYLRVLCLLLWWPGVTVLIASSQGLCILYHFQNRRQLRPWEQHFDENTSAGANDTASVRQLRRSIEVAFGGGKHIGGGHARSASASSAILDPLRKASLQTFGPRNNPGHEPWVAGYAAKPLWERIFDLTIPVQNQSLQLLQDRTVLLALIAGGVVATALAIGSVFVPAVNLF